MGSVKSVLTEKKLLVVDNAFELSDAMKNQLERIMDINGVPQGLSYFNYEFVQATSPEAFEKISEHTDILVSTTFTNIKSNAFEDLLAAAIKHGLKNKNIYSLMQFSIVGSSFEDYGPEIGELDKNNVRFYFLSEDCTRFNEY